MNKKAILTLIFCFCFIASFANAAESNILPNNPFYFFKDLGRNIQDFLTLNPSDKAELRLNIAEEKLVEIEKLAEKNPDIDYDKYLQNYENAIEKFEKQASILDENSSKKEEILDNVTSKILEHGERLEQLKEKIATEEAKINEIKNRALNAYTESSLKIANQEEVQNKIQEKVQNMEDEQALKVVNRIEEKAPQNLKSILNKIEVVQRIREKGIDNYGQALKETIQEGQLLDKVNKDAAKLGLTPEEILEKVQTFSDDDKKALERYAFEILSGNKSEENIVNNLGELNLSDDAIQKIQSLKNTNAERVQNQGQSTQIKTQVQTNTQPLNPSTSSNTTSVLDAASKYCINQGNKLLVQIDESGNEIKICVSPNGQKCNIDDYYNKKCTF